MHFFGTLPQLRIVQRRELINSRKAEDVDGLDV